MSINLHKNLANKFSLNTKTQGNDEEYSQCKPTEKFHLQDKLSQGH